MVPVTKLNAKTLLESIDVDQIIGLDRTLCNMPISMGGMNEHVMVGDPCSVGVKLREELQPALQELAREVILSKTANKFYESEVEFRQQNVTLALTKIVFGVSHSHDAKSIDALCDKVTEASKEGRGLNGMTAYIESITTDITKALENKVQTLSLYKGNFR